MVIQFFIYLFFLPTSRVCLSLTLYVEAALSDYKDICSFANFVLSS